MRFAPGHPHSPIPSQRDIEEQARVEIVGIDLRTDEQVALLETLQVARPQGPRYHDPDNEWFALGDAGLYQAMIRHFRPGRVVEVGSGWSTAALFDAGAAPHVTLIDPDFRRVRELLSADDLTRCELVEGRLQDVPLSTFQQLEAGDVLFVDSTHVAKLGSDVNRIVFQILPEIASGVIVHFHDVFFPFEYPEEWVREGWGWNEAYLLRAFLEYNDSFEILVWNDMMRAMGHVADGGGSIWLRKR